MRGYQPSDYNVRPNRYSADNSVRIHRLQRASRQYLHKLVCVICNFHCVGSIKWSSLPKIPSSLKFTAISTAYICLFLMLQIKHMQDSYKNNCFKTQLITIGIVWIVIKTYITQR